MDWNLKIDCLPRTSLARWFGFTERASRFLTERQAQQIYEEGMRFIRMHLELSRVSCRRFGFNRLLIMLQILIRPPKQVFPARQAQLTWAIKPKLHTFEHQLIEMKRTRASPLYCRFFVLEMVS